MTSNDAATAARDLFQDAVVPLSAAHPELRLDFAPERVEGSFYRPAFRPVLTRADMERGGQGGELAELGQLWADTPLATLLPGIERLADVVARERAVLADDPDAPSTLIYQMY